MSVFGRIFRSSIKRDEISLGIKELKGKLQLEIRHFDDIKAFFLELAEIFGTDSKEGKIIYYWNQTKPIFFYKFKDLDDLQEFINKLPEKLESIISFLRQDIKINIEEQEVAERLKHFAITNNGIFISMQVAGRTKDITFTRQGFENFRQNIENLIKNITLLYEIVIKYRWVGKLIEKDVISEIKQLIADSLLIIDRIRFRIQDEVRYAFRMAKLEELNYTKIRVEFLKCDLYFGVISRILQGKLPLFYYHGTNITFLDLIIKAGGLVSKERRETMKLVDNTRTSKLDDSKKREQARIYIKNYKLKYHNDIETYKRLRDIRVNNEKIIENFDENIKLAYQRLFNHENLVPILIILERLTRDLLIVVAKNNEDFNSGFAKISRDITKNHSGIIANLLRFIGMDTAMVFQFIKYCQHHTIRVVIESAIQNQNDPINLWVIRDKWFVFFGAEEPYKAHETIETIGSQYVKGGAGWDDFLLFEVKPSFYAFIEWYEIYEQSERGPLADLPESKLTRDLITKKKVSFDFIIRIYCSPQNIELVQTKLRQYNINVEVTTFNEQRSIFSNTIRLLREIEASYLNTL